ncbi:MAG: sulfatase-like hydrolase/transferase, partial [Planctomycetes bacterium]|nr:sulfatase-like hydrolase/transferase [Planctomycetota bacterium]
MRILYLDLDTLRPDHLGCYGYRRNTSPNIDIIAGEGIRFDNYYCSDAPCLPSRTALMTGAFGIHSGVVGHGGTAADLRLQGAERGFVDRLRHSSLPAMLRRAGLKTVSISPFAERHSNRSFAAARYRNSSAATRANSSEHTPRHLHGQAHAQESNLHISCGKSLRFSLKHRNPCANMNANQRPGAARSGDVAQLGE